VVAAVEEWGVHRAFHPRNKTEDLHLTYTSHAAIAVELTTCWMGISTTWYYSDAIVADLQQGGRQSPVEGVSRQQKMD